MKIITETTRLVIREFTRDDAQAVYDFNAPEAVNRYTGDVGCCNSLEDALSIIENIWLTEYAQYGFGRWAVVLKETGKVIGFCGFKHEPSLKGVDIGYRFHPDYWGQGIATEANLACFAYARTHMALVEVFGEVVTENIDSIKVIKKLGMEFVKQYQQDGYNIAQYKVLL
jgi:[ribosomal protein S5]-alanine N-acetyltransferase